MASNSKLTHESLMATIAEVASAERITKAGLATLSRDLLTFVLGTQDIRAVNALLGENEDGTFVLTPINHRIAIQYFAHFLPHKSNFQTVKDYAVKGEGERQALVFGGKNKKKYDEKMAEVEAWLADERNDIWAWSNNVEMETKAPDYAKKVQQAVKAAMNPEKGDMSADQLLEVLIGTEGVSLGMLVDAVERIGSEEQREAA
tara:strand:- start:27384 stop:27992 length:609 start_codon:yes stop_codon:yes gene_type:complete